MAAALVELLTALLHLDPDRRITAELALQHPFIARRTPPPPPLAIPAASSSSDPVSPVRRGGSAVGALGPCYVGSNPGSPLPGSPLARAVNPLLVKLSYVAKDLIFCH